jgi:hypothetical protein
MVELGSSFSISKATVLIISALHIRNTKQSMASPDDYGA